MTPSLCTAARQDECPSTGWGLAAKCAYGPAMPGQGADALQRGRLPANLRPRPACTDWNRRGTWATGAAEPPSSVTSGHRRARHQRATPAEDHRARRLAQFYGAPQRAPRRPSRSLLVSGPSRRDRGCVSASLCMTDAASLCTWMSSVETATGRCAASSSRTSSGTPLIVICTGMNAL